MLREGHCIARCLRGSGGGGWPHGGDVTLLNLACGNRGTVRPAISIEQKVWKLALLIGVPIPDPVESPRTGLQLAVLAGNQGTQEMKVTRLKHRETPGQSLHDLCRGQRLWKDTAPSHI